jgi:fermentation-respiration switch protein FrsA (DUF1100 family)
MALVFAFVHRWRFPVAALLVTLVGYGAVLAYVYANQRSLLYFPSHTYVSLAEAEADPSLREFPVHTEDGLDLKGWYAPAASKRLTLVFFHGNGDNLRSVAPVAAIYIRAGYGILLAEYRGYSGLPGEPTEVGLHADARAYVKAVIAAGVDVHDIVPMGHSLGTGVAAQVATEFPVGGLVLVSPYLSMVNEAEAEFGFLPVSLLLKDRYETDKKIKSVTAPVLIANGALDGLIAPSQGRDLFNLANQPKEFYSSPVSGHNDMFQNDFPQASVLWLDRSSIGNAERNSP